MSDIRIEVALPPAAMAALTAEVTRIVLDALGDRNESEFVTPVEAAEILRCPRQRVYDLASAGLLERYKDGGRTLHRREDVIALIKPERR